MKIANILMFNALFFSYSVSCIAADETSNITYDKSQSKIIADNGNSFLSFEERDEGNTSYFFDYFGGMPSVVHDSDSLDSYSAYTILKKIQNGFGADCIYLDAKSGSNGVTSKEGHCGVNLSFANKSSLSGEEGDTVVNGIIEANNKINTSYFVNGKMKHLPIMLFQSAEEYVYKFYQSKDELENGAYKIISCKNDNSNCVVYGNDTWVTMTSKPVPAIRFETLKKSNDKSTFEDARPAETAVNISSMAPFEVKSPKAYLQLPTGAKSKSYLIKGDRVTLLSISNDNCSIRYLNNKNKALYSIASCKDLNLQ